MIDILKGLASGRWAFFVAWVLPGAIAVAAFAFVIFPAIDHLPVLADVASLQPVEKSLVLAFSPLVLGVVLNASSTPLYRLLEGYTWPKPIRDWGTGRQKSRKRKLEQLVKDQSGVEQELAYEKLHRYPADDEQICATRLGNALRAFETYGKDRFGLDSQTFWTELNAVVPGSLRDDLEDARASVDFFVNLLFQSGGFAAIALAVGLLGEERRAILLTSAVLAVLLGWMWYLLAVSSCSYWSDTVQALVHLGRTRLASALGLRLPDTLEEERAMWLQASRLVFYPAGHEREGDVDRFRSVPTEST